MKFVAGCVICLLCISCTKHPDSGDEYIVQTKEAQAYINTLASTIRTSSKIVVMEHSWECDYIDPETDTCLPKKQKIYKSITLNSAQKSQLLSAVESIQPLEYQLYTACVFNPHHSIIFFLNEKKHSKLEVCFECADSKWDFRYENTPMQLTSTMGEFFTDIGLDTTQDWASLAKQ